METDLPRDTILNGKWRVTSKIGQGACATVYSVVPNTTSLQAMVGTIRYVAKCISYGGPGVSKAKKKEAEKLASTLNLEMNLLGPGKLLADFNYRPRVPFEHFYGRDESLSIAYLIIEHLDYDLLHWSQGKHIPSGRKPSLNEIAEVGLSILDGVEWLHKKGWLYVDFKPENFMFRGNDVLFIDYGLCECYASMGAFGAAPVVAAGGPINGTPSYVSHHVFMNGAKGRPNDEVESVALVLLALVGGGVLPWSNASSDSDMRKIRSNLNIFNFAASIGAPELGEMIAVSRLQTGRLPDYDTCKQLLNQMKSNPKNSTKKSGKNSSSSAPSIDDTGSLQAGRAKRAVSCSVKPVTSAKTSSASTEDTIDTKKKKSDINAVARSTSLHVQPASHIDLTDVHEEVASLSRLTRSASKRKGDAIIDTNNSSASSQIFRIRTAASASDTEVVSTPTPAISKKPSKQSRTVAKVLDLTEEEKECTEHEISSHNQLKSLIAETVRFEIVSGPHKGQSIKIPTPVKRSASTTSIAVSVPSSRIIIGRDEGDVILPRDSEISSRHAIVLCTENASGSWDVNIQDQESTNGTKVDGKRLPPKHWQKLTSGSQIQIGKSTLNIVVK